MRQFLHSVFARADNACWLKVDAHEKADKIVTDARPWDHPRIQRDPIAAAFWTFIGASCSLLAYVTRPRKIGD